MILPLEKDLRLTLVRRGGTLNDEDHRLLALWAADCAERVLVAFEAVCPDPRPRAALEAARSWARGDLTVTEAKTAAYHANQAARPLFGPPRWAAYAAAQAALVAHVPAHDLGAAAYAIRACDDQAAEAVWQRSRLPDAIRTLVIEDQARRNPLCWNVFPGT